MTYWELLSALIKLGPDALQKEVQILDDNGTAHPVDSFITGDDTAGLTDDPFQSLLLF